MRGVQVVKKGLIIFIVLIFLFGCNSGRNNNLITDLKDEIREGVNLWTSVNYDIVKDKQLISAIDKPSHPLETPIMLRLFIETINKGSLAAESIHIKINEPTPFLQINSTGHSGVSDGLLNKDETFEYYFTYTFANEEDLDSFINQASVSLTWIENQTNKEIRLSLPNKPVN